MAIHFEPGQQCTLNLPGGIFPATIVDIVEGTEDQWIVRLNNPEADPTQISKE